MNLLNYTMLHCISPCIRGRWIRSIISCGLVALVSGCGTTTIRESHLMMTQDKRGSIAYYRLSLSGDAQLAKTTYRAGLYDAEALDALMGETSSELSGGDTSDQVIIRLRKQAINQIGGQYYTALAQTNTPQTEITELARRMGQAFASPYDVAANATPEGQIKPQRKFAIIFSANASIVEEAIADFVESKETQDTLNSAIASVKRDSYIESAVEKQRLDDNKSILKKLEADAETLGTAPTAPVPGAAPSAAFTVYPDQVRKLLETLADLPSN